MANDDLFAETAIRARCRVHDGYPSAVPIVLSALDLGVRLRPDVVLAKRKEGL
jgi:hypothetical protein